MNELEKLLHPIQIVDVSETDPFAALLEFSKLSAYKILVCGGDGTVGWILNCVQDLVDHVGNGGPFSEGQLRSASSSSTSLNKMGERNLPLGVAILPIGTGNDLAIELAWGQCYMNEPLAAYLERIMYADTVCLDRWELRCLSAPAMSRSADLDAILGDPHTRVLSLL
jgi:diacylglycerol kinase (ATP)